MLARSQWKRDPFDMAQVPLSCIESETVDSEVQESHILK